MSLLVNCGCPSSAGQNALSRFVRLIGWPLTSRVAASWLFDSCSNTSVTLSTPLFASPFDGRPTVELAVDLEANVVVEASGNVLLNDEPQVPTSRLDLGRFRFRRPGEIPFLSVALQQPLAPLLLFDSHAEVEASKPVSVQLRLLQRAHDHHCKPTIVGLQHDPYRVFPGQARNTLQQRRYHVAH